MNALTGPLHSFLHQVIPGAPQSVLDPPGRGEEDVDLAGLDSLDVPAISPGDPLLHHDTLTTSQKSLRHSWFASTTPPIGSREPIESAPRSPRAR